MKDTMGRKVRLMCLDNGGVIAVFTWSYYSAVIKTSFLYFCRSLLTFPFIGATAFDYSFLYMFSWQRWSVHFLRIHPCQQPPEHWSAAQSLCCHHFSIPCPYLVCQALFFLLQLLFDFWSQLFDPNQLSQDCQQYCQLQQETQKRFYMVTEEFQSPYKISCQ